MFSVALGDLLVDPPQADKDAADAGRLLFIVDENDSMVCVFCCCVFQFQKL